MATGSTRRELLLAAGGGGRALAQTAGDEAVVARAVALEQTIVASYDAAVASIATTPPTARTLRRFRRQERQHVELLVSALDTLGGRPPAAPRGVAALTSARADAGLRHPLDRLRSEREVAAFAIELENAALAFYHDAIRRLRDPRLTTLATQVMGAEAQHATVLRSLLSSDVAVVVPGAFERGGAGVP